MKEYNFQTKNQKLVFLKTIKNFLEKGQSIQYKKIFKYVQIYFLIKFGVEFNGFFRFFLIIDHIKTAIKKRVYLHIFL